MASPLKAVLPRIRRNGCKATYCLQNALYMELFTYDLDLNHLPTQNIRYKETGLEVKKKKIKFALENAMKAQRETKRYSSTLSLTSALDGGGWLTPRHGCLTPGKTPVTYYKGSWLSPRAGMHWCGSSRLHRDSSPRQSSL